jgi:hypothetical protein
MLFEITKLKSKGRFKTFRIESDLEMLKARIDNDKGIIIVRLIEDGEKSTIVWKLNNDKMLSQSGSWDHLQKYSISTKSIMKEKRELSTIEKIV